MLRVNDSNDGPFAKAAGALLSPPAGAEERIWVCGGETSDLQKHHPGAEGVSTHHWRVTTRNQPFFSNKLVLSQVREEVDKKQIL